MPFCKNCGAELQAEDEFCPYCGVSIGGAKKAKRRPAYAKVRTTDKKACFGPRGSGGGMWGAVSVGVFVVGFGLLLLFDVFWPGILILIGLMVLIGSLVAFSSR